VGWLEGWLEVTCGWLGDLSWEWLVVDLGVSLELAGIVEIRDELEARKHYENGTAQSSPSYY